MSSLDYLELCRLCLVKDNVSLPIFEDEGDERQIYFKISSCLPVKVLREDKLPKKICDECGYKVELLYQFWNTSVNAEKQLLQWLGEVGGLEDKQDFVTEVLDPSVLKQDRSGNTRLDGNVLQVSGQGNIDINMIDNMSIITIPAGSEQQFTTVPMDTSVVQAVAGPSTQVTHEQLVQSQADVSQIVGEESEEDNYDDGCDNDDGMAVKEETEEDHNEQSTFANVSLPCDEAGPSGLQQSELTAQTADGDHKSGNCLINGKELRITLPRWTDLEIEMMKAQIKEYKWFVPTSTPAGSLAEEKRPWLRRRKYVRKKPLRSYCCKLCHKWIRGCRNYLSHKQKCPKKKRHRNKQARENGELEEEEEEDDEDKENIEFGEDKDEMDKFEVRPLIVCKDCKEPFPTTREIFEHRRELSCRRKLAEDGEDEPEESELSEATDDEYEYDVLYACPACRAKFVSAELLARHREREDHFGPRKLTELPAEHGPEDFIFRSCGDDQYSCADCDGTSVYLDPDDLLKHHRAAHSSLDGKVYCRYCAGRLAGGVAEFQDHQRAYHELQRHCRDCGPAGRRHNQQLGPRANKPLCPRCYRGRGLLNGDLGDDCMALLKESLYCDSCARALPSLGHVRFHHCQQPGAPLVCPLCCASFSGLRSLYRHVIKHNDVFGHRCADCGRLHETWRALRLHARKCHNLNELCLPRMDTETLRRNAEAVIARFERNGVKLAV